MNCRWSDEISHRFVDETLDAKTREGFARHLPGCATCRERVAAARQLEGLLRAGITPVPAPTTLASRVAGAVAAERERAARPQPRLFGRWSFSPALAGLALALVLGLTSFVIAPEAVTALARRLLIFIPGLGIERVAEDTLVSAAPVALQLGDLTLTVEALLSNGQETTVRYTVTGLPGAKSGWERQEPPRTPTLLDASGHEYAILGAFAGVGGAPEGNLVHGTLHLAPLPGDLRSVQLVLPVDYVVPPSVLPGSDSQAWVVDVALVPAQESSLPAATPQSAESTVQGITLRVAASTREAERTILLVEGEAEGQALLTSLGRLGGSSDQAPILTDGRGRSYPLLPSASSGSFLRQVFRQDLYFQPLPAGAGQLTLRVPAVQVLEEAAAEVTISLAGHQLGESWALERTLDLGGHPIRLLSTQLDHGPSGCPEQDQPWLYVQADLGATANGRTLARFSAERLGGSAAMQSLGGLGGQQMDEFGVPVDLGAGQVTLQLSGPIVTVDGPWELTFAADG